jgi:uncharacterized protein YneF (UPF0154 family)
MNLVLLILIGAATVALIIFLVIRNLKDKKQFEQELNNNFPENKNGEDDIEIEEVMK